MSQVMSFALNPSTPIVYLTLTRMLTAKEKTGTDGNTVTITLRPTRMEYVSSVVASDMLEVTVPDPEYMLINSPFLAEDMRTEATLVFGYEGTQYMSAPTTLIFYRQKPSFPSSGEVSTTLTFYDKGIFLGLPLGPKAWKKKGGWTVKEMLQEVLRLAKEEFSVDFNLDVGDLDLVSSDSKVRRVHKGPKSLMQFLYWIREVYAVSFPNGGRPEIFVRNNTLYFRPGNKRVAPVGKFYYHSHIMGERLLSFEPKVELRPKFQLVGGVENETGEIIEDDAGPKTDTPRPVLMHGVYATDGTRVHRMAESGGDMVGKKPEPKAGKALTHTVKAGDTLVAIAERYNVALDVLARANGIADPSKAQLTPGMQLTVPQPLAGARVTLPETKGQAAKALWLRFV